MSESTIKIKHANIEWRNNQPYATSFQDVYFSSDDGLAETNYVFLQGNQLLQRWQSLQSETFTIIETGFGTGLNFLCAVQLWLTYAPNYAVLQFYSVEKYPLDLHNMQLALQYWPTLNAISQPFLAQYAQFFNGVQTISLFNNRVKLSLLIGDATEQIATLKHSADVWFLDGFAPSKNPEMWQTALYTQMARLSNQNTTFATFTSAGNVRRGLLAAGFAANKRTGFGKKREMLHGQFLGFSHA
jgi:tRNA 5-methylaminomethyl-2-thiouridine biosynthesis bifunctional protein